MTETPLAEAQGVTRRFNRQPDFAERLAIRLGAAAEPPVVHALDGVVGLACVCRPKHSLDGLGG